MSNILSIFGKPPGKPVITLTTVKQQEQKENSPMGFILKGVWKRKVVEHPNDMRYIAVEVASLHPYNVRWDQDLQQKYISLYGQEEFNTLVESCKSGAYNVVESYEQRFVQGGSFVPADPIPEEVLGPDEEWKQTPFGKIRVKKSAHAGAGGAVVGLTAQEMEALIDRVVMSCLKRAGMIPPAQ